MSSFITVALALLSGASAYSPSGRRAFLSAATRSAASVVAVSSSAAVSPRHALAADDGELDQVYFGAGCFWHVQHEFSR